MPRPRLHALLDESSAVPLTLVVAPAGSGKTTLLGGWVRQTVLPTAWLTLDETDRDPAQLWRAMLAALDQIAPGCARSAIDLFRQPDLLHTAVGALLDDLETRTNPATVLVLDDLHLVDDDGISSLALFLQHLPAWLHLVVASRRTPRLPVHRLRARGELRELHFPELRFSHDEAAAMLGRLTPGLDAHRVAEAVSRAGGWAASIQLAALSARTEKARPTPTPAASGHERRMLEDYVWHEMLRGEPTDVIDVLLATSVVERIEPGLARVLAARTDADDLLSIAHERGLFVSHAEPDGTFQVHALVRDVLQDILETSDPGRARRLHSWAAGWHQAHGRTDAALDQWLKAGRPREALHLLFTDLGALTDGGHLNTIARVLQSVTDSGTPLDTQAAIELAWCRLPVDRHQFLRQTEHLITTTRTEPRTARYLVDQVNLLASTAALLRGDWSSAAESTAANPVATAPVGALGRDPWNTRVRGAALVERWDDAESLSRDDLASPVSRARTEARALGEALAGRPVAALELVAAARRSVLGLPTPLGAELAVAEAIARREIGDSGTAVRSLTRLVARSSESVPYCRLLAALELTQARIDVGELESASRAFDIAVELVETEMPGSGARARLGLTGLSLSVSTGDLATARIWAMSVEDRFWSPVATAKVLLAGHEVGPAFDQLKDAEPRCVRHRVVGDLLRFRSSADPAYGEGCLLRATSLASAHGLVRTVAGEGHVVVDAVERSAWRYPPSWLTRLRRLSVDAVPVARPATRYPRDLSARELEVLRMLPSRLTLHEISDELFISINTLKFHLRGIYRKLGASSRSEAVESARELVRSRGPQR